MLDRALLTVLNPWSDCILVFAMMARCFGDQVVMCREVASLEGLPQRFAVLGVVNVVNDTVLRGYISGENV